VTHPGWRGWLRTHRWELLAALGLALALATLHLWVTSQHPLDRVIWSDQQGAYLDPQGGEADAHLDRLLSLEALRGTPGGPVARLGAALEAGDRAYPPLSPVTAALWNLVVGPGIVATLLINIAWLGLLLGALHGMARAAGGARAGWLATLLALACPVILGPSRHLHHDLPMLALLACNGWFLLRTVLSARPGWAVGAALAGGLALLCKWEASAGLLAVSAGAGLLALLSPGRKRTLPALAGALVGCVALAWLYQALVPSHSLTTRPELAFLMDPGELSRSLKLLEPGPSPLDGPPPRPEYSGPEALVYRALFYVEAVPAAAVGVLATIPLLLGLACAAHRSTRRFLAFGLGWGMAAFGIIVVTVDAFCDDRFVHYFLLPWLVLAGAGLARLPKPRLVLGAVGVICLLQAWDMSLSTSPLPATPFMWMERPSVYYPDYRAIALQPGAPFGHTSWLRPEQRVPAPQAAVRGALQDLAALEPTAVVLSPSCERLCTASNLWVMEDRLAGGILGVPMGLDAGLPHHIGALEGRCDDARRSGVLERVMVPGVVFVMDEAQLGTPASLAGVDWDRETCGEHAALGAGAQPHILGQRAVPGGSLYWVAWREPQATAPGAQL
jgi:hypothetical protein